MKVTATRATTVNIPPLAPHRFSYGSIASLTKTIVEVDTDAGVTSIGECSDGNRSTDVRAFEERLICADFRCVPKINYTPWANVLTARRAFGSIEMAFWEPRGKIEGNLFEPGNGRAAIPTGSGIGIKLARGSPEALPCAIPERRTVSGRSRRSS